MVAVGCPGVRQIRFQSRLFHFPTQGPQISHFSHSVLGFLTCIMESQQLPQRTAGELVSLRSPAECCSVYGSPLGQTPPSGPLPGGVRMSQRAVSPRPPPRQPPGVWNSPDSQETASRWQCSWTLQSIASGGVLLAGQKLTLRLADTKTGCLMGRQQHSVYTDVLCPCCSPHITDATC